VVLVDNKMVIEPYIAPERSGENMRMKDKKRITDYQEQRHMLRGFFTAEWLI